MIQPLRWLLAGLALLLALLLRWLLAPWLGASAPFATLFGAVAIAVWIGGWRPALVVAVLGYVAADLLFGGPRVPSAGTIAGASLVALSIAIIVFLGQRARAARARSAARLDELRRGVEQRDQLLLGLREVERQGREARDRLRLALDSAGAALCVRDLATGRMTWDDRFHRLLGFEPGSVEPSLERWRSRIHPDDLPRVERESRRCLDQVHACEARYRLALPDGSVRWVQSCGVARRAPDGTPRAVLEVSFDITSRRIAELTLGESERALRAANTELSETDRRKDEFLAMLGHELRNPLGAIANSVQLLQRSTAVDPSVALARDIIGRQASHLGRIVDDLLDVSRVTQGKIALRPEPADLRSAVGLGVELTRGAIEERGQPLAVTVPAEPVMVSGEISRLAQVVGNLLNNASKFSEPASPIHVALEVEPGEAVLRVVDRGAGISAAVLPRIFDVFVQGDEPLDRSRGGLGIGLSLARALVELHGGTIHAASDGPGCGSRFEVRLPLLAAAETRAEAPDRAKAAPRAEAPARGEPPARANGHGGQANGDQEPGPASQPIASVQAG